MQSLLDDPNTADYALPDEERKRMMLTNLLLGLGAGLGGARRGQEFGGLAQGGAQGAMMGQQAVMEAMKARGMTMTQALQGQKLKQEIAQGKRMDDWLGGGGAIPGAAPGGGDPAAFTAPGAAADRFGPEGPPAGTAPPVPRGRTGNVTIDHFMTQARNLGIEAPVWATIMSDRGTGEGIKAASKLIADAAKPQAVRPGETMWSPDGGSQFVAPHLAVGQEYKNGVVNTMPGFSQSQAEIAGATQTAQEQAKAGLDLVEVPLPNGQKVMMPRDQAAALLGGKQQSPRVNMDRPPTPREMAWMAQNSGAPTGGLGMTQTPADAERVKAEIDTAANKERTGYSGMVENSKTMYEDIRKQYFSARDLDSHVANMERLEKNGVFNGPIQNWAGKWANTWNSAFPGASVNEQKLANTQTYGAEVGKMQQAIARTFPGSQSDRELAALTNSLPTLMQSPEGRAQIFDTLHRKIADSKVAYTSASQHMKQNDGNLVGWEPPPFTPPGATFGQTQTGKRLVWNGKKLVPAE